MDTRIILLLAFTLGVSGFIVAKDIIKNDRFGWKEAVHIKQNDKDGNWKWDDNWSNHDRHTNVDNNVVVPPAPEPPNENFQVVSTSYESALKDSANYKKPILIFMEADWCSWCKKMERQTLTDSNVKEAMKKFVFLKVNVDREQSVYRKFGGNGIPCYAITNSKEETLKKGAGFKSPDEFVSWLKSL